MGRRRHSEQYDHLRLVMPAEMDRLDAVEAIGGEDILVKAKREHRGRTFARERALEQALARYRTAYDHTIDKMFKELMRYVGETIVGARMKLTKSEADGFVDGVAWPADEEMIGFASADPEKRRRVERKFSLLTPTQLETVKQIIRDYHLAFAAGAIGPDAIPADDLQRLVATGIMPEDLRLVFKPGPGDPEVAVQRVTDLAYQYGTILGDPAQKGALREMGATQFETHLERTRPELNDVERQAMGWARYSAGQHIRGMADRLSLETGVLIANADAEQRRRYLGTVQRELEEAIDTRQAWRELASDIGHATEDWSRDMGRLAATEMQFAMQEGQARSIAKRYDDPKDARVAKQPNPDACPDCIRLHLTAGAGSPPRIFKLSELQANGTNVGRKRADWKPTVGPVHPWCGCELIEVPDGWAFDEEGDLVPEVLLKKGDRRLEDTEEALAKGFMTYGGAVPTDTLVVRVADPVKRQVIESVLAEAPREIFDKDVGVTLITTDIPRAQNPLDEHDFAYWTANEIRLSQTLEVERIPRVLRHELGHSLNVWLMRKLGSTSAVRAWHDRLWAVSKEEGFVSEYATREPIENAAEVTRMYLFERPRLMLHHPQQFAFVHRDYKAIFRRGSR